MIRWHAEYEKTALELQQNLVVLETMKQRLAAQGLSPEQVEYALQPTLSWRVQLEEGTMVYERMCRGDLDSITNLRNIGRLLIGLRVASGKNVKQLADALGVSESVISRDERNEYHGISIIRAQRIVDACGGKVELSVVPKNISLNS